MLEHVKFSDISKQSSSWMMMEQGKTFLIYIHSWVSKNHDFIMIWCCFGYVKENYVFWICRSLFYHISWNCGRKKYVSLFCRSRRTSYSWKVHILLMKYLEMAISLYSCCIWIFGLCSRNFRLLVLLHSPLGRREMFYLDLDTELVVVIKKNLRIDWSGSRRSETGLLESGKRTFSELIGWRMMY